MPYSTSLVTNGLNDIGNGTFPHSIVAVLNYRKDRLAITPSVQFNTGNFYGAPTNVIGVDPRGCASNSAGKYPTAPSPLQGRLHNLYGPGANHLRRLVCP